MLRLMIYLSTPILLPGYLPGTPGPLWLNASEELAPPDRAFMIAGINGQMRPKSTHDQIMVRARNARMLNSGITGHNSPVGKQGRGADAIPQPPSPSTARPVALRPQQTTVTSNEARKASTTELLKFLVAIATWHAAWPSRA